MRTFEVIGSGQTSLNYLNLSHETITDKAAIALADALPRSQLVSLRCHCEAVGASPTVREARLREIPWGTKSALVR
jgi:hypothetical protein